MPCSISRPKTHPAQGSCASHAQRRLAPATIRSSLRSRNTGCRCIGGIGAWERFLYSDRPGRELSLCPGCRCQRAGRSGCLRAIASHQSVTMPCIRCRTLRTPAGPIRGACGPLQAPGGPTSLHMVRECHVLLDERALLPLTRPPVVRAIDDRKIGRTVASGITTPNLISLSRIDRSLW